MKGLNLGFLAPWRCITTFPELIEIAGLSGRRLAGPVEAALYYVVSESLANAAKHAAPSHARVELGCDDDACFVEIADDGPGGAEFGTGSGLQGLADRVAALGGRLALESPPGGGTTVRADLPLR